MEHLFPFCITDRQREILQAIIDNGSQRAAARALNVSKNNVDQMMAAIRKRAAKAGIAPDRDLNYPLTDIEQIGRAHV